MHKPQCSMGDLIPGDSCSRAVEWHYSYLSYATLAM